MRRWFLPVCFVVLLAAGCARPAPPALRSGEIVRPDITFAPREPWPAGAKVAIGVLLRVDRDGGEARYLRDDEVIPERAVMRGRVTFLADAGPLGEPLEVPFVRDC